MEKIFDYCWKNHIINVNVQVQKASGEIIIYTYFPFQESSCGNTKPVEINRFINETMENDILFPSKLQNMYQCPLRAAIWDTAPFVMLDFKKTGRNIISGFEGKLLLTLSELMNFKIDISVPPNNEKRGTVSRHKKTGAIGMLQRNVADLSLGCFWYSENRSRILTATHAYFQSSNVVLLLSDSPIYKSKYALWFPFDCQASLILFATFIINLGLFYYLTGLTSKWSLLMTEAKNRGIWLNFFASTLAMPTSIKGLQRTSIRIFIMAWILFTLVVRTKYGAVIYHLIRNNLFIKPPTSINEILNLNYTLAMNRVGLAETGETSIDNRLKRAIVEGNHANMVFEYLEERPNEKIITIIPLEFLLYYLVKYRKLGVFKIFKEKFTTQNSCIYLTKHSYLADKINSLLLRINSVGLMNAWVEQSIDFSYFKGKRQPKVMTIGHEKLIGVYFLCGLMLVVAFVIFCLEILSKRLISKGADIAIGGYSGSDPNRSIITPSVLYYHTPIVFVIRGKRELDCVNRLFRPFSVPVWQSIGSLLLAGAFLIQFLRIFKQPERELIIGERNLTPLMNFLAVFLGYPVTRIPQGISARYLLILWLAVTLILRSAYQGSLYDSIRIDRFEKVPRKYNELFRQNYKIFITKFYRSVADDMFVGNQTIVLSSNHYGRLEMLEAMDGNYGTVALRDHVINYLEKNFRNGSDLRIIEETVFQFRFAWYLQKHSIFAPIVNDYLLQFGYTGLPNGTLLLNNVHFSCNPCVIGG
ncbi:uncharacterized protein LOC129909674 [Episyrphus balteatus]|uniref:uncharacterized protein LOC129909674 n=1 Tax=Episyrphus balteatus TaxID=286459 RepID=UPI00248652C0|nr:uncharacterized protein LOC129909674 [Episyrphus balteatus]